MFKQKAELTDFLQAVYKKYHHNHFLPSDPLCLVHDYQENRDKELIAFLCAIFAYGNVMHIKKFLTRLLNVLGGSPYDFLMELDIESLKDNISGLYYRFQNNNDVIILILTLSLIIRKNESLEKAFISSYAKPTDEFELKEGLSGFVQYIRKTSREVSSLNKISMGEYYNFLFPDPKDGSCCKRLNLFLRWVVRNDNIDLGIWTAISPDKLLMPLDVHLGRIVKSLGLTKKKNSNWSMAEEVTKNLSQICPTDPTKYDFSLCRIGILKTCPTSPKDSSCPECEIEDICMFKK